MARVVTPRRTIARAHLREHLARQGVHVRVRLDRSERCTRRVGRRDAWAKCADLAQEDPLRLGTADHHHVAGSSLALQHRMDPRDDAESQQERRHVLGEPVAARGEVHRRAAASARLPQRDRAVGGPEVAQQQSQLVVGEREYAGGQPLLVRALTEDAELPQPEVDAGRVPAVPVAADDELVPGPAPDVPVDGRSELAAGGLGYSVGCCLRMPSCSAAADGRDSCRHQRGGRAAPAGRPARSPCGLAPGRAGRGRSDRRFGAPRRVPSPTLRAGGGDPSLASSDRSPAARRTPAGGPTHQTLSLGGHGQPPVVRDGEHLRRRSRPARGCGRRRPSASTTSVSPATHSRRSDSCGRRSVRASGARDSCDSAITGHGQLLGQALHRAADRGQLLLAVLDAPPTR